MAPRFKSNERTQRLLYLAMMTALVAVLACIKIPIGMFSITLTLPAIVIGVAICGPLAGAWLGCVFSTVVMIVDAQAFLAISVVGTAVTVYAKGILSGLAAGLVYMLLKKSVPKLAVYAAGITAPVVNTGLFLLGCLIFFYDTVASWFTGNVAEYVFLTLGVGNFLIELTLNLIFCPIILRLIDLVKNKRASR